MRGRTGASGPRHAARSESRASTTRFTSGTRRHANARGLLASAGSDQPLQCLRARSSARLVRPRHSRASRARNAPRDRTGTCSATAQRSLRGGRRAHRGGGRGAEAHAGCDPSHAPNNAAAPGATARPGLPERAARGEGSWTCRGNRQRLLTRRRDSSGATRAHGFVPPEQREPARSGLPPAGSAALDVASPPEPASAAAMACSVDPSAHAAPPQRARCAAVRRPGVRDAPARATNRKSREDAIVARWAFAISRHRIGDHGLARDRTSFAPRSTETPRER